MKRTMTFNVSPTPKELAHEFAYLDDVGQAEFFNCLAKEVSTWDTPFCFQLQYVSNNPLLTDEGRGIMKEIGTYGGD
jgi:hypothetical protein